MTLRLIPGSQSKDAAEELRRQEIAVGNVRTGGYGPEEFLAKYLSWAIEAERMLRNHFTGHSIASVIFTRRYWALQTWGTNNWEPARALAEAEIVEQRERLLAEKALLDEGKSRWRWGRLLVLDTSALVHGTELQHWDPAEELGLGDESVQLILPMLVFDELDDLKESTKQHTRNRARRTLKWLSENMGPENAGAQDHFLVRHERVADRSDGSVSRGKVYLDVLLDPAEHVRLPVADDEIVDRAAAIASSSGREVTLVTNDASQAYRARLAGLSVSQVTEPVYDVDIQEAAVAAKRESKAREAAERRAAHEAGRGKRRHGIEGHAASSTQPDTGRPDE